MADLVWRYPIPTLALKGITFDLEVREGAQGIHVGLLRTEPTIYVRLDPKKPVQKHRFVVVKCGQPIPDGATFVGTLTMRDMSWKWHVFQVGPVT